MKRIKIPLPTINFGATGRYTSDAEIGKTIGSRITVAQPEGWPIHAALQYRVATALVGGTTRLFKAWTHSQSTGTTWAQQLGLLRYNVTSNPLASINTHAGEALAGREHILLLTNGYDTTNDIQLPQPGVLWNDFLWFTINHDYAGADTGVYDMNLLLWV